MAHQEVIFNSKIKYNGVFSFKEFYKFCYDWLTQETDLELAESKYAEKIAGEAKEIDIEWNGERKFTDYFKMKAKVEFQIKGLKEVELTQAGKKLKTNSGSVEVKAKGTIVRDYDGKFESSPFKKFLRGIYEKWVIASRIEQYETKIFKDMDEFLTEAKAFLDLEGKK